MKTIWKYPIINDSKINIPVGATVLSVGIKDKDLFLWCLLDTEVQEVQERRFMTFKTNDAIPRDLKMNYIGNCSIIKDRMFFHTFEVIQ